MKVMKVILKFPAKVGKILLPKGTEGIVVGISNSPEIAAAFPNLREKTDGYYYICRFPNVSDCLFDLKQLEFSSI